MGHKAKITVVLDSKIIPINRMDNIVTKNIEDKFSKMKKHKFKRKIFNNMEAIIFPANNQKGEISEAKEKLGI